MENSNESLRDELILLALFLMRYSRYLSLESSSILRSSDKDIISIINENNLNSSFISKKDWMKFNSTLKEIKKIRRSYWNKVNKFLVSELKSFIKEDVSLYERKIKKSLPVKIKTKKVPDEVFTSIIETRQIEGRTIEQWIDKISNDDEARLSNIIKKGLLNEENLTVLIKGEKELNYSNGIAVIALHQLETMIRTVSSFISNEGRKEFLLANSNHFQKEIYVAVLDSRTTEFCRETDGKVFNIGEGPYPPIHFNCRSCRVPYLNDVNYKEVKPTIEDAILNEFVNKNNLEDKNNLPYGYKNKFYEYRKQRISEIIGKPTSTISYPDWLKIMSHNIQEQILGRSNAKEFRNGNINLNKFIDSSKKVLNLQQYKEK
jgi:SPP1 gp7 family putative phage head morphogenesis protein